MKKNDRPDLLHVHVGMKAGAIAKWTKKVYNIPYLVSEHWTGFLAEATGKFRDLPWAYRKIWAQVMTYSNGVSAVSVYLLNALKKEFPGIHGRVIPNVVNSMVFNPSLNEPASLKFIHVSGLSDFKNPEMIVEAMALVKKKYSGVQLEMIGSTRNEIVQLSKEKGLENNITFYDEMPQPVLARHIKNSKALILYSKYETFGCVIIEANASGIPVIVSDIPVFHEIVEEGENGFFVKPNDPAALAEKIITVIESQSLPGQAKLAGSILSKYGYATVAQKFVDWYREVLEN
jgi:glycosyltransferase involved in cell wall biosynthesis